MKNLASPYKRILANLIDSGLSWMVFWALLVPVSNATSVFGLLNSTMLVVIQLLVYFGFIWPVLTCYFISAFGGSLGKKFVGLSIVDEKGSHLSFKMALFRTYIGYAISGMLFGAGYYWIWKDEKRQGWHDQVCDTFVVADRSLGWLTGILVFVAVNIINIAILIYVFGTMGEHETIYQQIGDEISTMVPDKE